MVQIKNLAFSYKKRGKNPSLFSDLALDLDQGGIYGLLGKNGAGKTSLLRLMSGQLFPHAGSCSVLGENPADRTPSLLSQIYFLPEEFHVPPISGNAYREIYATFYPNFDVARFAELIGEFELDPEQRLSSLSYGQKKKFLLAFALATRCRVLLLDEPTNGLDIPSKRQFRRSVAATAADNQIILISTHQVRDMENLIDPIIVIDSGKIVFFHELDLVSRAMSVSTDVSEPRGESVLYVEKSVTGYTALKKGAGTGSAVDLELLFNALMSSSEQIEEACIEAASGEETSNE